MTRIYKEGYSVESKPTLKELHELRAFKAQHEAKTKAKVTATNATLAKPIATKKTIEVKQDKRRARVGDGKAIKFDYNSPEFLAALKSCAH